MLIFPLLALNFIKELLTFGSWVKSVLNTFCRIYCSYCSYSILYTYLQYIAYAVKSPQIKSCRLFVSFDIIRLYVGTSWVCLFQRGYFQQDNSKAYMYVLKSLFFRQFAEDLLHHNSNLNIGLIKMLIPWPVPTYVLIAIIFIVLMKS